MHACHRPQWEGGKFVGDESSRQNALQLALNLGANFIDIELKVSRNIIQCCSVYGIWIFVSCLFFAHMNCLPPLSSLILDSTYYMSKRNLYRVLVFFHITVPILNMELG